MRPEFHYEVRTEDGMMNKKSSLQAFRQGLCRYFSDYRKINIMKDSDLKVWWQFYMQYKIPFSSQVNVQTVKPTFVVDLLLF